MASRARDRIGGRARPRGNDPALKTAARARAVRAVRDQRLPCAICGHPIDYTLAARTRWSFTVDEIVPRSVGGSATDPANLRPAHQTCNSRRGAHHGNHLRRTRTQPDPTTINQRW